MLEKIINFLAKITWNHVVFALGIAAGLIYYSLDTTEIDSKNESYQITQTQLGNLQKKVEEARKFESEYGVKKKQYAEMVRELQQLQGSLPKQFFLPDLLSDLLREAKRLEIEITQIAPDQHEEQKDLYNSLGFNIDFKGSFFQFFIFLDRMANMKRLVNVASFSLSKDSERPAITLGGQEGAFAASKMGGGRTVYPGVRGSIRIITYRYRGSSAPVGGK